MELSLKPLGARVLVELAEQYEHLATTEGKYDTKTSGICVAIGEDWAEWKKLIGQRIFWKAYDEGEHIKRNGKKYAFIKMEAIDGFEDDKAD